MAEANHQQWKASQAILQSRLKEIQEAYRKDNFWDSLNGDLSIKNRKTISDRLDEKLECLLRAPSEIKDIVILHQLSEPDHAKLLSWIEQSLNTVPQQILQMGKRLEELDRRYNEISLKLQKVPEDDVLKPLIRELNDLHEKLGHLNAVMSRKDETLLSLDHQRQEAIQKLEKAYDKLRGGERLEKRLSLVESVQKVINRFSRQLTREKINELENLVVTRFNELSRKPDLIKKVKIDPETFSILLANKKSIKKEQLSAGEKQMFAIALLWALRQLSGRPFPVVIDTPLGRLDSEHRSHLIERYFPYVSHQVILFSTDMEVDQDYFRDLAPYISHSYHLNYDSEEGATQVETGYFWNKTVLDISEGNLQA
jgi:DNA sulfur modification protein DndD